MKTKKLVFKAKVSPNGQVTIPKGIRQLLGLGPNSGVSFVVDASGVYLVNTFKYALQEFQKEMKGEGSKLGLDSEEAVVDVIMKMRKGEDF